MKKYAALVLMIVSLLFIQARFFHSPPVDKVTLGKLLFFDTILSRDRTISCASCHKPEFAFADSVAFSAGVGGKPGVRNSPTAMNVSGSRRPFFWDGRAGSLEEQALRPIEDATEMDLSVEIAVKRLREDKTYRDHFMAVFNREPDAASLAEVISAFERSLETSESPFDDWKFSEREDAVSEPAKRGFELFSGKARCSQCHFGSDFSTHTFRNIGLFDGKKLNDSGRFVVTRDATDIGRFKTPTLRNVAITAPYMHNGMLKTLEEVITFYDDPAKIVPGSINRDSLLLKPLGLTAAEKSDLREFLLTLTDKRFKKE
jgi:cytochrome c peroxidase